MPVPEDVSVPGPIDESMVELESISSSISMSEDDGEDAPEPIEEPELASVPIVVESVVVADDDVDVFAIAGSAKAATTSDVQINFFIKPPVF